jgi:hypothetical protein
MARFLFEWMRGEGFVADQFKAPVQASLQAELVQLLQAALTEPGGLATLLTSPRGFVDATLEAFYGLPVGPKSADGWRAVDLGASGRVGILTHPLLMARTAHGLVPSVVLRGKFVRLGLLCGELLPPPPGAAAEQPVLPRGATERDASDARMKMPTCGGCHRLMDPIGLGLLGIDGVGRPRADDAHGEILDGGDVTGAFSGASELGRRLAASDDVARCFARQWFRYSFGRQDRAGPPDERDQCAVDAMMAQFTSSGRRLATLFSSLAGLDGFGAGVSP